MKRRFMKVLGITIILSVIAAGAVYAFSLGTTDGVWGEIDSTLPGEANGANCDGYGAVTSATYTLHDVIGVIYNTNYGPGGEDERYVRNASVCGGDINGDGTFSEWTRTGGTPIWTGLGSHTTSCDPATGLYISEYVYEAVSGEDRVGVEIYNGTGAAINLGTEGYELFFFYDDRYWETVDLTGTVADNDVFVVVTNAAADQTGEEDQTFSPDDDNRNDLRTVVLIEDYTYMTIDAMDFSWPEDVQDNSLLDENQVRYGRPESYYNCPSDATGFDLQSGFGFEGIENRPFEPDEGEYFPVGRFCHYNNPIYRESSGDNPMKQVPLELTINDIGCPAGQTFIGTSNDLTFSYLVNLDETINSGEGDTGICKYGYFSPQWPGGENEPNQTGDTGPNRDGCADMVNFTAQTSQVEFTCRISSDPVIEQDYTVSIIGFTSTTAGGVCPNVPVGTLSFNQIYTAETTKNCYCVYAAYTTDDVTPVTLASMTVTGVDDGILIAWETVSEVNTLGFNIYRADQPDGDRSLVNQELIMSELAPGEMFGASYEFLDETAEVGVTYYYWLEDVPLDGSTPGLYGPMSAVR